MKSQFFKRLQNPPRIGPKDLIWTLIPLLFWWIGTSYARSHWIQPRCGAHPELCSAASVNSVDRIAIHMEDGDADGFSLLTQNASGVLAIGVPILWSGVQIATGIVAPAVGIVQTVVDLLLFGQAAAWNGTFIELSHLIGQRPRPFVYSNPSTMGQDPAHYTSFYSGHTSFSALAMMFLFLTLLSRRASPGILILTAVTGETLVFLTAFFRVLAGRHFISDVLVAALMGALIAGVVVFTHRQKPTIF